MKFYNPWAFLGLVSIPIIIVMYILKQKYEEKKFRAFSYGKRP